MNRRSPPPLKRLLIVPAGPPPSPADVRAFLARAGVDQTWSDAAFEQLIRAGTAAERWLAERPENARQLVEDPAGALEGMRRAGLLPEPVDDLLAVLRALGRRADAKDAARLVRGGTAVRVGAKPPLRARPPTGSKPGGGRRAAPYDRSRGDPPGR